MRLTRSQMAHKKRSCSPIVLRTVQALMEKKVSPPPPGELLLYGTEDGRTRVECRFLEDSLWLSQARIAELYAVSVKTANEHRVNIFAAGEPCGARRLSRPADRAVQLHLQIQTSAARLHW